VLFVSVPFSIAGDDFAITGLYLVTIYRLATRQDRLACNPIMFGMGLMMFGALISALFSGEALLSLSYFRNFWRLGLPFLVLLAFRNRPPDRYLRTLAVVAGIVAIYGVIQFFSGLDVLRSAARQAEYRKAWDVWHAVGVFSHHLTFGGVFLMLFALFTPAAFNREIGRWDRLLFFWAGAGSLLASMASMGRSIWLGSAAAISVMLLVLLGRRRSVFLIVAVLILALGTVAVTRNSGLESSIGRSYLGHRIRSISIEANRDRIMMWKAAIRAIQERPLLGLGPNRRDLLQIHYDAVSRKYQHEFQHPARVGVHNLYLQNWVDFGLLGMAGYLAWWLTLIAQILSSLKQGPLSGRRNTTLLGCLAGFAGIMVAGFFENNFRDGEVQVAILLAMGLALVMLERKTGAERTADLPPAT